MTILFEVGIACGASDFTERAIEVVEEGARHNPDVTTLTGLALNMRGLFNRDSAMVAESVKVLQHSPRRVLRAIGAEGYGGMLLKAGEREAALHQLDAAWDDYDHMGASARRAAVQRVMRQAARGAQSGSATTTTRSPGHSRRPNGEWRIWSPTATPTRRLPGRLAYPLIPWGPTFARYIRSLQSSRACSWPMRCTNAAN
jgi:hypothetical protein